MVDSAIERIEGWNFPDGFDHLIQRGQILEGLEKLTIGEIYAISFYHGESGYSGKAKLVSERKCLVTGEPIYDFAGVGELKSMGIAKEKGGKD